MAGVKVNLWQLVSDTREDGDDGQITRVRTWRARLSGPTDSPMPVETYRDCPRRWEFHPADSRCRCVARTIEPEDNKRFWRVVATYTNRFEAAKDDDKNPLERRAKINVKTTNIAVPFLMDVKGKPRCNTAGEPFANSTTTVPGRVFSVVKNLPNYPNWLLDNYSRSTNSDVVTIRGKRCERGTLHLDAISIGDEETDQGVLYYEVGFELHHNPLGWKRRDLNRGFYELETKLRTVFDARGNITKKEKRYELKKIKLDDGEVPTEPQWLDAKGRWIKPLDGSGRIDPSQIIILEFDEWYELPYSRLPLR